MRARSGWHDVQCHPRRACRLVRACVHAKHTRVRAARRSEWISTAEALKHGRNAGLPGVGVGGPHDPRRGLAGCAHGART